MGGWWGRVRVEGRGLEWEAGRGLGRKVDASPRPEPPSLLQSPSPSTLPAASPAIATVLAAVLAAADAGECDCGNRKAIVSFTSRVTNSSLLFLRLRLRDPFPPSPLHDSPAVFFRPPPPPWSGERRLKPERGWREGDWGGRTRRIPCGPRPTLNSRCSASARRPHRIVSILGGG